MEEIGFDEFEKWNTLAPRGGHPGYHPYAPTRECLFLYVNVTTPLPQAHSHSAWSWFNSFDELLAYLYNVVIPDLAIIWLELDGNLVDSPREPLASIVSRGIEISPGHKEFFAKLEQDLVNISQTTGDRISLLDAAIDRFNQMFSSTSTYDSTILLFPEIEEAFEFSLERVIDTLAPEDEERIEAQLREAFSNLDHDEDSKGLVAEMFCVDTL